MENINIQDSDIKPEMTFKHLVYLNMQKLTNFPYIEKDFDALTDYQLLCLVVKYLNDVIENSNEQNASIMNLYNAFLALQDYMNNSVQELEDAWNDKTTELETAFNNLQTWIDNYFDNLDVQEEINNKLDQMLEDGVLEQIIEQFIQSSALWCFDTVSDMKLATNLVNGSYAKTLGYYTKNDNGQGLYKIRTKEESDVDDNGSIIELSNNLVAELIIDKSITPEQFGAYGDGVHNDTASFTNALKMNKPIILKDNATYNIIKIYTYTIPNIVMYANNKSTIKWDITTTQEIANFEGMFTDDNPLVQADPNGGNIYLKNIIFNGNGDNITDFPNTGNFGLFHLKARDYVNIENCKFEKIHCDGINLRGYKICNVKNTTFENIGRYQNADGTRNGMTISREYGSRVDDTNKSLTDTPITNIENCKFSHITDECIRIDGCSNLKFINNVCDNIGHHIIESGHKTDGSDYTVLISNIVANKIGSGVYVFGADGGGTWNYTGNILVENSKFHNMCYQDDFSQYKRNARPYIIPGYNSNYSVYSPNIEIINCEFISIDDTLTYDSLQKMIFGKNVYVKDSIFEYHNNGAGVPMFQGVNILLDNIKYKIKEQTSSKFGINGLEGNITLLNSSFEVKEFAYLLNVNNCNTYIENCKFIENTTSTSYRYITTVKSTADYLSSFSMINSSVVNKDTSGTSTNCFAFLSTEGNIDYNLDQVRMLGNCYSFNNVNGKSFMIGTNDNFNLKVNANNNKYNA